MKIKTVNLTRIFRVGSSEIAAVNKVNFEVKDTSFVAIVGPSGSGKSTFLNLLGLNDYPTYGKIFIDDLDSSLFSGARRRKMRLTKIGFVFQTFNLFPTLTALENVELPMTLLGKSQREQREKALKLLGNMGLDERVFHRPKELSMGEMQRVAIARALVNDPKMIIADEPTGELDSQTAKEIISLLFDIYKEKKTTMIIATHDAKIMDIAEKVYSIQDGKLKLEK